MACVQSEVTDLSWRPGCRRFSSMTHERVKRVRSLSRFPVPSFSSMMFRLLILGPSSVLCESGIMPRGGRGRKKKYRVVTKRWNVPLPADAAARRRERSRACWSVRLDASSILRIPMHPLFVSKAVCLSMFKIGADVSARCARKKFRVSSDSCGAEGGKRFIQTSSPLKSPHVSQSVSSRCWDSSNL